MSEARENRTARQVRPDADGDDQIAVAISRPATGVVLMAVAGEVDMLTSPQLRAMVLEQLEVGGVERLVLALDGVTFLGTSGLAVLVELREATRAAGVELRLSSATHQVLRPLEIAGLIPLFGMYATVDAALM